MMLTVADYEIRVKGPLTAALATSFDGMRTTPREADTVLTGAVADQAALHGLLDRLALLGLELVEVRRLTSPEP